MWAFSFFGRVDMMQNLWNSIVGQGCLTIQAKEADIKVLDIFLSVTEIQL